MDETTRITMIVKGVYLRNAIADFVVKTRGMFYSFVSAHEAGCIGQYHIVVEVRRDHLTEVRTILNTWMVEDIHIKDAPYPNGSLLHYSSAVANEFVNH